MTAMALMFDTLQYAKRLKEAGFTEKQAEVQAEALLELVEERLATKDDLNSLKKELKHDIKMLEKELRHDIKGLEKDIIEMGYKLTIKLGSLIVAGVVTLGGFLGLIKFLA